MEQEGYAFFVAIEYEKLPLFCSHCKIIGHTLSSCKWQKNSAPTPNESQVKQGMRKPVKKNVAKNPIRDSDQPACVCNQELVQKDKNV